jgi:hypothetical protein
MNSVPVREWQSAIHDATAGLFSLLSLPQTLVIRDITVPFARDEPAVTLSYNFVSVITAIKCGAQQSALLIKTHLNSFFHRKMVTFIAPTYTTKNIL